MNFNAHGELTGRHATLSPSSYHWINYTDEKLEIWFNNRLEAARGTALHEFAHQAITLGIKLPRSPKTINMYVNDAIGFRMESEQLLYYSDNCFGTADAIRFEPKKLSLRIHDLKNGISPASMHQLEVYAALFCLEYGIEYGFRPGDLDIELRIYQNDEIEIFVPELDDIIRIMDRIVVFSRRIDQMKMEAFR